MVDPLLILEAGRQAGIAGAHLVGIRGRGDAGRAVSLRRPTRTIAGRAPADGNCLRQRIEPLKLRMGRVRGMVKQSSTWTVSRSARTDGG